MKPLLNNLAIGQLVRHIYDRHGHLNPLYAGYVRPDFIDLLRRVRDDYEAERAILYQRIAELEAERGEEQP